MSLFFRNLLPIGLVALMIWLLQPMFAARMACWRGATVISTVTGHYSSNPSHGHSSSYPILSYQLPANWPIAAGSTQSFEVPWTSSSSSYEMGAEIQLQLPRDSAFEPLIFSFEGFWFVPLAAIVFGSAIITVCVFTAPTPSAQERRRLQREQVKKRKRNRKSAALPDTVTAVEISPPKVKAIPTPKWPRFASNTAPIFSPLLLVVIAPVLLMVVPFFIIAGNFRSIVLRLWHILKPNDDEESDERTGFFGLVNDLVQSASMIGVMSGFALVCSFLTVHFADKVAGELSWSLAPANTIRTILWLPQDFDDAFCVARERQDASARIWLLAHGARPNVVCESQPDALAERE